MQARKNKCSLSFRLKVSIDWKSLNDCGRAFHNTAEAKGKWSTTAGLKIVHG